MAIHDIHPYQQRFVIDESRMTQEENKVLHLLADAWNEFIKLPTQHPQDVEEFLHAIHMAQEKVAIRGVRIPDSMEFIAGSSCHCFGSETYTFDTFMPEGIDQKEL